MSDFSAFGSMERRGWGDATRAAGYVELFASASDQAIDRLLDAAGAQSGIKALDMCCGQGNVSEALLRRTGAFEILSPRQLSIVAFRYVPPGFAGAGVAGEAGHPGQRSGQ